MKLLSQSYVFKTLRTMQRNFVLCDLELVADDGERVFVHSLIWVAAFEYSEQCKSDIRSFQGSMKTLDLPGINGLLLHDVVDFIYGENIEIGKLLEITKILKKLGMKNGQICLDGCPMSDTKVSQQGVNINGNHDNSILQRSSSSPNEDISSIRKPGDNISLQNSRNSIDKATSTKIKRSHGNRVLKRSSSGSKTVDQYNSNGEIIGENVKIQTESDHDTVTVKVEYDLPAGDTEMEQLEDMSTSSPGNNTEYIKQERTTLLLNNNMYGASSETNKSVEDMDIETYDINRVKVEPLSPTANDNQSELESDKCNSQAQLVISNTFSMKQMESNMNTLLNRYTDETTECSSSDKHNLKSVHQHETLNPTTSANKTEENKESRDKVEIVTLATFVPVNPEQNNTKYRQIAPKGLMPPSGESVKRQLAPKRLAPSCDKTVSDKNAVLKLPICRPTTGTDTSSPSEKSCMENTVENVMKSSDMKTHGHQIKNSPKKTDKPDGSIKHGVPNGKLQQQNSSKRGRPRGSTHRSKMDSGSKMDSVKCRKVISVETIYRQIVPKLLKCTDETISDKNIALKLPIQRPTNQTDTSSPSEKSGIENTNENVTKSSDMKVDGHQIKNSPNKNDKPDGSIEHGVPNGKPQQQNLDKRGRPRGSTHSSKIDSVKCRKLISGETDYRQDSVKCRKLISVETVYRQIVPKLLNCSDETISDKNTALKLPIQRPKSGTNASSTSTIEKSCTKNTNENAKQSSVMKTDGHSTENSPNETEKPDGSIAHGVSNGKPKQQNSAKRGRPRGSYQKFIIQSGKCKKIISQNKNKQHNPYRTAVIASVTSPNILSTPVSMTSTTSQPVTMTPKSCKPIAIRPTTSQPVTVTSVKSENIDIATQAVGPTVNLQMNCNTFTCSSSLATPVVSSIPVVGDVALPPPQVPSQLGTSNCYIFGQPAMSFNQVLQPVTNYIQTQNPVAQPYNISQMPMTFQFMQNNSTINTPSTSSGPIQTANSMLVQNQQSVLADNQTLPNFNTQKPIPQPVQLFQNLSSAEPNGIFSKQTTSSQRMLLPNPNPPSDKKHTGKYILPKQNPPIKLESPPKSVVSDKNLRKSLSRINRYKKLADKMKKTKKNNKT